MKNISSDGLTTHAQETHATVHPGDALAVLYSPVSDSDTVSSATAGSLGSRHAALVRALTQNDAPTGGDERQTALKQLLEKHVGDIDASSLPSGRKAALKQLLAKHITETGDSALHIRSLDLSHLVQGMEGDIAIQIVFSNPQVGAVLGAASDYVEVRYDAQDGSFLISGNADEVQQLLAALQFIPSTQSVADFYLNVSVTPINEPKMAHLTTVKFEPDSGHFVSLSPIHSSGTTQHVADNVLGFSQHPLEAKLGEMILQQLQQAESPLLQLSAETSASAGASSDLVASSTDPTENHSRDDLLEENETAETIIPAAPEEAEEEETPPPVVVEEPVEEDNNANNGPPPPSPPTATPDTYTTSVNVPLVIDATNTLDGLLDNDSDINNDPFTLIAIDAATANGGTLVDNLDGTYTYTPPALYVGDDTFTYTIDDGVDGPSIGTVTVTVINSPLVSTNINATETYTEDNALDFVNDLVIGSDQTDVTITLTMSDVGAGDLNTATSGAVTSTFVAGVWQASGAIADVNTLLAGLTFTPTADYDSNFTIGVNIVDGVNLPINSTLTLNATAVNDVPVLTGVDSPLNLTEAAAQTGTQLLDADVGLADVDNPDFDGGALTVTYTAVGIATDQLSVRNQGVGAGQIGFDGTTVTYAGVAIATVNGGNNGANGADLILDFNANSSATAIEALIENLTFTTTSEAHDSARTVEITATDGDGGSTVTGTITVNITDATENVAFTAGVDNFSGGDANDTITGSASDWGAADVIDMGTGTDEINLGTAGLATIGTNVVGAFTVNLADVGSYVFTVANAAATAITFAGDGLTGVNALLVDASAFTHTLTLTSGDGDDQITVGSGTTNLTLGDGNNTVTVADSALNNALSITGGTGTDVLLISDSAAISNSDLNNISGIDTIRLGANSASMIIVNTYVNATDDGDTLIIDNQGFTLSSLRTSQLSGGNGVTITGTGQVTLSNHDNNTITIADGVNGDIMGGTQRDIIYGGTGNDVVNSRNDHDSVLGGDGDDDLFGDRNNDTLDGGSGNDTLNGGREHDSLIGGTGNDDLFGDRHNDTLEGGDGNDTLDGGNEVDQLTGGADADTLTGGAGADTFIFLATTDSSLANIDIITDFSTLEDTIDLTALGALDYIDSAAFSGAANEVRWEIDAPNNRTLVEVDTTADGIADMRVELTGQFGMNYGHFVGAVTDASSPGTFVLTIGNDDMGYDNGTDLFQTTAANFAAADTLVGGFGTDVLEFLDTITITAADWANKDSIEVLQFDAGGSTVEITNTFVNSSYSDDVEIDNQGFAITLDTSDLTGARDVFISGTGTVTLADGAHNRNVKTTTNVAVDIDGGTGNDEIFGANKNDVITGGLGNDTISAGNGSNTIDGGDGNDRLITGSGADDIIGGDGNDNITAGNGADDIDAGDGNDTINSGRHNDTVLGGDGDDVINGERENDSIDGGAGNDTITGERHIDTLTGGTGDDIFVFSANNHSTTGANRDLITDFNNTIETDTIDVSAFGGVFSFLVGGNGIADFTGAQEIAWEQTGGDTLIYVDSNGNGSANFEIGLAGLVNLTAADFVL